MEKKLREGQVMKLENIIGLEPIVHRTCGFESHLGHKN